MNRISNIQKDMKNGSPVYNMKILLDKLSPAKIIPEPNKYYTFVYIAKTPYIQYDQHPLVLVGNVFNWGFSGYNLHWEDSRKYTWNEVQSNIFEIYEEEIDTAKSLDTAYIRSN